MKFTARISSRSSKSNSGPPGETEILRLNPERRERLLRATGWPTLYEGTLNLEVHPGIVEDLGRLTPFIHEPADSIIYPEPYQHIPRKRKAYLYYRGLLRYEGQSEEVLLRTAENPLKTRLEAFAPGKLRDTLGLSDGFEVECEIRSA